MHNLTMRIHTQKMCELSVEDEEVLLNRCTDKSAGITRIVSSGPSDQAAPSRVSTSRSLALAADTSLSEPCAHQGSPFRVLLALPISYTCRSATCRTHVGSRTQNIPYVIMACRTRVRLGRTSFWLWRLVFEDRTPGKVAHTWGAWRQKTLAMDRMQERRRPDHQPHS